MARLAPGRYRGHIVRWKLGENKNGNLMLVFTVCLDARLGRDGETPMDGEERDVTLWLTETALQYSVKDLRALGYDRNDLDGLDPDGAEPFQFGEIDVGLEMKLESGRDDPSKQYERWSFRLGGGGAGPQVAKPDAGRFRALNAVFGSVARQAPPPSQPRRSAPPRPQQELPRAEEPYNTGTPSDDAIPF